MLDFALGIGVLRTIWNKVSLHNKHGNFTYSGVFTKKSMSAIGSRGINALKISWQYLQPDSGIVNLVTRIPSNITVQAIFRRYVDYSKHTQFQRRQRTNSGVQWESLCPRLRGGVYDFRHERLFRRTARLIHQSRQTFPMLLQGPRQWKC